MSNFRRRIMLSNTGKKLYEYSAIISASSSAEKSGSKSPYTWTGGTGFTLKTTFSNHITYIRFELLNSDDYSILRAYETDATLTSDSISIGCSAKAEMSSSSTSNPLDVIAWNNYLSYSAYTFDFQTSTMSVFLNSGGISSTTYPSSSLVRVIIKTDADISGYTFNLQSSEYNPVYVSKVPETGVWQ